MAEAVEATKTPTSLPDSVEAGRVEHKLRTWQSFLTSRWLEREQQPSPSSDETKEHPIVPRPSRKVVPGIPRPSTFRRQTSEQRERLESVEPTPIEPPTASVRRQTALTARPASSLDSASLELARSEPPQPGTIVSPRNVDDEIDHLRKVEQFINLSDEGLEIDHNEKNSLESLSPVTSHVDSPAIHTSKASQESACMLDIGASLPVDYLTDQLFLVNSVGTTKSAFDTSKSTLSKWKRGLSGFVNGKRISALPDTGSLRNVMSQAFAQEMNLRIEHSPSNFMVGNTKLVKSIGTVIFDWAFSESPKDLMKIVCDVIPNCSYPIILGSRFLATTQTLSKYKRRLTKCLFSLSNILQMNFLGDDCQRLFGHLGTDTEAVAVAAVPDTGAEGNIMDYSFAHAHGLRIRKGPARRNILQFADGTYQETVGQVETYWTFGSGERIPVTFEVLENCCTDVILGESILYNHNVFEDHTSSLMVIASDSDAYQLAPFDFVNRWQRSWPSIKDCFKTGKNSGQASSTPPKSRIEGLRQQETRRQEDWDYQYSFGETASEAEKAAEARRRANLRALLQDPPPTPPGAGPQQTSAYQVPSIPTAPNRLSPQRP